MFRFPVGGRDFPPFRSGQVGSGAHPTYVGRYLVRFARGCEADHFPSSNARLGMDGPISALPICLYGVDRDGFTFTDCGYGSENVNSLLHRIGCKCDRASYIYISKEMYQLDATIYYDFILIKSLYMFGTFTCPSSGVLINRLFTASFGVMP